MVYILGDATDETLAGGADNDTIEGMGGNDTLTGWAGDDVLDGGSGNDVITDDGRDTLYGGLGDDTLTAGGDAGMAYGGAGNDRLVMGGFFDPSNGASGRAFGGEGDDTIVMDGGYYQGSGISGRALAGGGNDIVSFIAPVNGYADGGAGNDLLAISVSGNFGTLTGGMIDFSTGAGSFSGPGDLSLTFTDFERLFFQGNAAADSVTGGALDDVAYLYGGQNVADMGSGNDVVAARYGAQQTLTGGDGDDVLILMDPTTPFYFVISGFEGNVDDGQLSEITGFERYEIVGGTGNDYISLGAGDDTGNGWTGADTIYGMQGDDQLRGEGGTDSLYGGDGNDMLIGDAGNDVLYGDSGNDYLRLSRGEDYGFGGRGKDRIVFNDGNQTGWGGEGRDVFIFRGVDDRYDWIGDFASGEDRLRFVASELAGAPGAVGEVRLSNGSFVGTDPQFLFLMVGSNGHLFWDADGSGPQDSVALVITANGATILASDIQFII